ncbi:MAG: tRNA (adenosine(37)-N6)-threonylcarbamoyltransferase complex ATPase subunit type 1 TsaE [bacterium]|nr:tRNA (adenosine(37)-N6)-threonylcarbamoyltransferase complex ATPase subunit type 1 TsaE [bacterium]
MRVVTKSASETKKLGKILAKEALKTICKNRLPHALVISLEGNLGSGKTTFAKGFARSLGVAKNILSPTFVLIKQYRFGRIGNFFHIDCYRLGRSRDMETLGLGDIFADSHAIVLIEWGNRLRRLLPKHRLTIKFSHTGPGTRRIVFFSSLEKL